MTYRGLTWLAPDEAQGATFTDRDDTVKRILGSILLLLVTCSSFAEERDVNEIINVRESDEQMNAAIHQASESLDLFVRRLQNPEQGDANFALKVEVADEHGVEHFWVSDIQVTDTGFQGIVANEARVVQAVELGQPIRFARDLVSDWSYDHEGVRQGAFTLKVLLERMPEDQADYYRKAVGWD